MFFNKRFLIVKNKGEKTIKYMEYNPDEGYKVSPKGNLRFEDAINIDKMVIISPTLISKMIDKKANKRIAYLLKLLNFIDNNDDSADEAIDLALDQATRFRQEIINKYAKYLDDEHQEFLNNKISIIEEELKLRKAYLNNYNQSKNDEYNRSR